MNVRIEYIVISHTCCTHNIIQRDSCDMLYRMANIINLKRKENLEPWMG